MMADPHGLERRTMRFVEGRDRFPAREGVALDGSGRGKRRSPFSRFFIYSRSRRFAGRPFSCENCDCVVNKTSHQPSSKAPWFSNLGGFSKGQNHAILPASPLLVIVEISKCQELQQPRGAQ